MKIKFLGSGGAFATLKQGNTNVVITINGKNLLIDLGSCSNFVWRDIWGRSFNEIDGLYISHVHADHCSLEQFFFSRYFIPTLDRAGHVIKPKLYAHPVVMNEIWEHLKPSMGIYRNEVLHLTNFAECHSCSDFEFEGAKFSLIKNSHIESSFGNKDAYGLFIQYNGKSIYWSSDCSKINKSPIEKADIIFHDCETLDGIESRVHTHYKDLTKLPSCVKRKMWLMHYNEQVPSFKEDGFMGFVERDQEFIF